MKTSFKNCIESLLQVNFRLNAFLKENKITFESSEEEFKAFQEKIENLLSEKTPFIQKLEELKKTSAEEFLQLKTSTYAESWKSLLALEEENLTAIKSSRAGISLELAGITRKSKAIYSYKYNKEIKPRLIDDKF